MELKLLEDFLCLADQRSFSRAAALRNVTQSALSKRIRALERWLGADLVNRSSHPVTLTHEGAAVLGPAREAAQMMRGLRTSVGGFARQPASSLSFIATHTILVSFMPSWRAAIEARTGKLTIGPIYQNTDYSDTLRQFRNGEVDFLLTYAHPAVALNFGDMACETLFLAREKVVPVSAPDSGGAPLHPIRSDQMVSMVSYGPSSFFAATISTLLADRPLALNAVATNSMCVGQRSVALVGAGMAWIPESLVRRDLAEGRLVRAGGAKWEFSVDILLCRRDEHRPETDRFWEAARQLAPEAQAHLGAVVLL